MDDALSLCMHTNQSISVALSHQPTAPCLRESQAASLSVITNKNVHIWFCSGNLSAQALDTIVSCVSSIVLCCSVPFEKLAHVPERKGRPNRHSSTYNSIEIPSHTH